MSTSFSTNPIRNASFPQAAGNASSANHQADQNQLLKQMIERAAVGLVLPHGNMSRVVKVNIDNQGDIYQTALEGYEKIGHLDAQGNYAFRNGVKGNCFRDPYFEISVDHQDNPFQKNMVTFKQQRASAGSIVPMIRERLTSKGIDGTGITVVDLEPFDEDEDSEQLTVSPHTRSVAAVIEDPFWGVAPGAKVQNIGWHSPNYEIKNDDINEFNQLFAVQQLYKEMNTQLQNVIEARKTNPGIRAVNISWGLSPLELYMEVLSVVQTEDKNTGLYKFPKIRQMILGDTAQKTPEEQFKRAIIYINRLFAENPVFGQWHQQFIQLTKQLAEQGVVVVASAANAHDQLPVNVPIPKGHEMCVWANSPYVISVAAADTNLTPEDTSDDIIAPFSSHGDGKNWNPTIAAPGTEIGLSQQYGPIGQALVTKGTSYSAPMTAGIIAMMFQQNPNLSFDQVRKILIETATDTPAPYEAEGYGMLNPVQAVLKAKQSAVGNQTNQTATNSSAT